MPVRKRGKAQTEIQAARPSARKKPTIDFYHDEHLSEDEADLDEGHVTSDEEGNQWKNKSSHIDSEDEQNVESLDAKRIRLAREYLKKVDDQSTSSSSSDDDSSEGEENDENQNSGINRKLTEKLARDRLKRTGALERIVAARVKADLDAVQDQIVVNNFGNYQEYSSATPEVQSRAWQQYEIGSSSSLSAQHPITFLKGHDLTVTCVALEANGSTAYSGSKDNSVLCWDIEKECCKSILQPMWKHSNEKNNASCCRAGEVLTLAASDDGRYVAVGGRDALIKIFDVRLSPTGGSSKVDQHGPVATFRGHKGPVTCLAFRSQSLQLFTGSEDRCIR